MWKRLLAMLFAVALVAAACGNDDSSDTAPAAPDASDDAAPEEPVTGPAALTAADQTADATTITIDSVTLPAPGFVAIHADNDGAPGAVIANSELLQAGDTTNVTITLAAALDADTTVYPMLHIDANNNGEYDFAPPDITDDVPATTTNDDVAFIGITYTGEEMTDDETMAPTGPAALTAADQTADATTITIDSVTLPAPGFVAIHADNDGAPGAVIANSELLQAGDTTNVTITLAAALDADTTVYPMLHIDANNNGEYDFAPPDITDDVPATTTNDDVAFIGITYTGG